MKNIQILTALLAVLTAVSLTACSPDIVEEEAEETLLEPIPEPDPHWADGIIEIETGRFQTGTEMLHVLERPNNINASISIRALLSNPDFPMSRQKKTIKVTVVTLLEAGFTEPAGSDKSIHDCKGFRLGQVQPRSRHNRMFLQHI